MEREELFEEDISLEPYYLNKHLDENLKDIILKRSEGHFSAKGYIKPGTVEILQRSEGHLLKNALGGQLRFTVNYKAVVIDPLVGLKTACKVTTINKIGIVCEQHPINYLIPREFGGNFDGIEIDDEITVEVVTKRIEDGIFNIVAKLVQPPPEEDPEDQEGQAEEQPEDEPEEKVAKKSKKQKGGTEKAKIMLSDMPLSGVKDDAEDVDLLEISDGDADDPIETISV